MKLEEILEDLVTDTPGGLGSLIISKEGITVAEYHRLKPTDSELLAAEYRRLCQDASDITQQLNLGTIRECIIETDKLYLSARFVNNFIIVLLSLTETHRGEALFHLRSTEHRLANELR